MLYDTIRNPRAPYVPPKTLVNASDQSKDTLESTQQRLNREMLHRLQSKGLHLPHESFVAVVQVGKYLFLAIMLPPYLVLYGLPRWLLVSLIPQLFDEAKNTGIAIGKFFSDLNKRVADLMKGILEQLLGDALRMTKHHAKNGWHHLLEAFKKITETIAQGQARLAAWKETAFNLISQARTQALHHLNSTLNAVSAWVTAKAEALSNRISHTASKAAQAVEQTLIAPVLAWLKPPALAIYNAYSSLRDTANVYAEGVRKRLQELLEPIVDAFDKVKDKTKRVLEKMTEPVMAWVEARKEALEELAHRAWKNVADPINEAVAAVKAKVEERLHTVFDMAKSFVYATPWALMQTAERTWKLTPKSTRQRMQRRRETLGRWARGSKNVVQGMASGVVGLGKAAKLLVVKTQQKLSRFWHWFLVGVRWTVSQVMLLPNKLMSVVKTIWKGINLILDIMVLAVRLIVAILWAGMRYSLIVLKQATKT